jgi:septum formation protein
VKNLILASQSPGRKQVLDAANVNFKIIVSNYVEDMSLKLKPQDLAIHLSAGKAREVASRVSNAIVIGADSFVVFKNKVVGKPHTVSKAIKILSMLSGQTHELVTGYTIIDSDTNKSLSDFVITKVYFKTLSPKMISEYIKSDNVLEKAGGYSIQGNGYKLVERIDGNADNLMGLPLANIVEALKEFDYKII